MNKFLELLKKILKGINWGDVGKEILDEAKDSYKKAKEDEKMTETATSSKERCNMSVTIAEENGTNGNGNGNGAIPEIPGTGKPTWQSTEFWQTMLTNLVGVAMLLGYINKSDGDQIVNAAGSVIGGVITLVNTWKYIHSRTAVKVAQCQAVAQVASIMRANGNGH